MKPKFIYFDLDDTLLNHKQAEQKALHDVYHHFDLFASTQPKQLVETYHRVNSEQWMLYSQSKVNREQLQRNRFEQTLRKLELDDSMFNEVGSQYMQFYRNHWQWVEGAEQAFQNIRNQYEVGILTNGFAETQQLKFDRFNLYEQAKHLVISEQVGALKPHPSVFNHATELTGYQPEEILYVGDSYSSDVLGGSNFGWNVAWFTPSDEPGQREKARFVFDDFKELENILNI